MHLFGKDSLPRFGFLCLFPSLFYLLAEVCYFFLGLNVSIVDCGLELEFMLELLGGLAVLLLDLTKFSEGLCVLGRVEDFIEDLLKICLV